MCPETHFSPPQRAARAKRPHGFDERPSVASPRKLHRIADGAAQLVVAGTVGRQPHRGADSSVGALTKRSGLSSRPTVCQPSALVIWCQAAHTRSPCVSDHLIGPVGGTHRSAFNAPDIQNRSSETHGIPIIRGHGLPRRQYLNAQPGHDREAGSHYSRFPISVDPTLLACPHRMQTTT